MSFGRKLDLDKDIGRKSGGGNSSGLWIKRVSGNEMTVRPLTEPDEWVKFTEVYDKGVRRSWPKPENGVITEHQDAKNAILAPMVDTENDYVIALKVPKSVADKFARRYQRHGTVCNRDWLIVKSGSGLDTEYDLEEDLEVERDLTKYIVPELEDVLKDAYQHAVDEGWTGADESPAEAVDPAPVLQEKGDPVGAEQESKPDGTVKSEPAEEVKAVNGMTADELDKLPLGKLRAMCRDAEINPSGLSKKEILDSLTGNDSF